MVNYDGTPKLPGTKQKTTAKKVQIRWTPDMKAHLTSLVRIKKPHPEGRKDRREESVASRTVGVALPNPIPVLITIT